MGGFFLGSGHSGGESAVYVRPATGRYILKPPGRRKEVVVHGCARLAGSRGAEEQRNKYPITMTM